MSLHYIEPLLKEVFIIYLKKKKKKKLNRLKFDPMTDSNK